MRKNQQHKKTKTKKNQAYTHHSEVNTFLHIIQYYFKNCTTLKTPLGKYNYDQNLNMYLSLNYSINGTQIKF